MMRILLLSLLLFPFVTIANGSDDSKPPVSVQAAAGHATAELNKKSLEIDKTVQNTAPDVQDKINAIQAPTTAVVPTLVSLVSGEQRKPLIDEVRSFAAYAETEERIYSRLSLVLICVSAGLALLGSIASFMSRNKTAGIISLIVAAVVGLSNAYPISPLADFYGNLKSQAKAIVADCRLANPYTETLYAADLAQYKLLLLQERNRPSIGKYTTDDALKEEMRSVGIVANNADTAKAAADQIVGFSNAKK
jgi:hypothetical protein